MKINTLEKYVFDHFFPSGGSLPSAKDACLANVVMHTLLMAPGFKDAYANHELVEWAPDFFRLGVRDLGESRPSWVDVFEEYYPSDIWYEDEDSDEEPQWIDLPKGQPPFATVAVPGALRQEAQFHLEQLRARHADLEALFSPSPVWAVERERVDIVRVDTEELYVLVKNVLGTEADPRLRRSGIRYHEPRASRYNRAPWVFWVAHNGDEVAGVLGAMVSGEDHSLDLSYVSVAPGFRNQGLAKRLMTVAMDYAVKEELFFVRSSPGVFSEKHPEVAHGLDRCVTAHTVPHVSGGSGAVAGALARARRELPWDAVCAIAKPLCDDWLKACPSLWGKRSLGYGAEEAFAKDFNEQAEQAAHRLPVAAPRSPRPLR